MLRRPETRNDTVLEGRRITNQMPLTFNKNINQLNRNLRLLLTPPEELDIDEVEFLHREERPRRKSLQSSSTRRLPGRNKENINTANHPAKDKKKSNSKPSSKSIKKNPPTDRSDIPCRGIQKKSKSPGGSLEKKTKSLSRLDRKIKKSKSLKRKSFSPQHSHRSGKLERTGYNTKRQSKPVTAYTSRETKSSYATVKAKLTTNDPRKTKREEEENEQSPNSLLQFRPVKHRAPRKILDDRPILKDSESISIAKQLQSLLDKHKKSKSQIFKGTKSKKLEKSKQQKSKKVIVSQQTSKQREYQSKEENDVNSELLSHRYRESYEPRGMKPPIHKKSVSKEKRSKEQQLSIKTEYSMPSFNVLENLAATKIQKCFRGYLARKQIVHYKRVISAAITIQRMWRGYIARKRYNKEIFNSNMPKPFDESLYTVKDFNLESAGKHDGISETSSVEPRDHSTPNSRNYSEDAHSPSPSLMLEQRERQLLMNNASKRLFPSPRPIKQLDLPLRQRPNMVIESPTSILQNLPNLQRIHRLKLLHHSRQQKQSLQRMVEQKMCSPRSFESKTKQIDERLQYEIERFESGIREVVRGWNLTNDEGFLTPDSKKDLEKKNEQNKKLINAFKNTYEQQPQEEDVRLDDLSVELSQYIEERPSLQQPDNLKLRFDSSMLFIEPYLTALFQFLKKQQSWKEEFLEIMKSPRNITINVLLKNLVCVTQDSQDDELFKLPLYKYLRCDNVQLIDNRLLEQFHDEYRLLKRHQDSPQAAELQETYLRMLVEVLNYELNRQRPTKALLDFQQLRFTAKVHPSLLSQDLPPAELLFHNYLAHALDELYRTANHLCGFIEDVKGIEQNYVTALNECRLTSMINYDTVRFDSDFKHFEEQWVQLLVCSAQQIVMLLMEEAAEDIWRAYV